MTPEEIIKQDAKNMGADPEQVLAGVNTAIHHGGKMLRENDSLLLLTPLHGSKEHMFLHLFSVAQPSVALKNVQKFITRVRSMPGLKRVYGDTTNQQVIRLLTMSGIQVMKSDVPQFTWMAEV